jgi:hypothetical protein
MIPSEIITGQFLGPYQSTFFEAIPVARILNVYTHLEAHTAFLLPTHILPRKPLAHISVQSKYRWQRHRSHAKGLFRRVCRGFEPERGVGHQYGEGLWHNWEQDNSGHRSRKVEVVWGDNGVWVTWSRTIGISFIRCP